MPSAFAKDGTHLSHEGSWQLACGLACAAFVELLRICGGEGEIEGSDAGGCTTSWRGSAGSPRAKPERHVHGHLY